MKTPHISWGRDGGGVNRGYGWISVCAAHPKQSTEESEGSNNGKLVILVPNEVTQTPLKHRKGTKGGEGRSVKGGLPTS